MGAAVLGVDPVGTLLGCANASAKNCPPERLRYLRHDLRTPLPETGFDVALQYLQLIRVWNGRGGRGHLPNIARRRQAGARVLVETNHRDLTCTVIARGSKASKRWQTALFPAPNPIFDANFRWVRLNWYLVLA